MAKKNLNTLLPNEISDKEAKKIYQFLSEHSKEDILSLIQMSKSQWLNKILEDSQNYQKILSLIKEEIVLWQTEYINEWAEGIVYKVNIPWLKTFLAIKKNKNFNKNFNNEYDSQQKAYDILKWNKNPYWVKVPNIIGIINENGAEYLVMEYIEWKTLYNHIMEYLLTQKKSIPVKTIQNLNDKDLTDIFLSKFWLHTEWDNYIKKRSKALSIIHEQKIKLSQNLDQKKSNAFVFVKKSIKEWLEILHKNEFYHRDLWNNPTNMILKKDWEYYIPYLIDFWFSAYGAMIDEENPYHNNSYVWDKISTMKLIDDMKILDYL